MMTFSIRRASKSPFSTCRSFAPKPGRWAAGLAMVVAVGLCLGWTAEATAQCERYQDYIHWVGGADTPDGAVDVAIAGDYAFIADGESGLQVANVQVPWHPQVVGGLDTPGSAHGVAIAGSYAYVADSEAGLQVFEIFDPEDPLLVGSVDTPGFAYGVAIDGGFAYIADGNSGLQIIDISNPLNPQIVGCDQQDVETLGCLKRRREREDK